MTSAENVSKYINALIRTHLGITYRSSALQVFDECPLVYLPLENILELTKPCLAIPTNISTSLVPKDIVEFEFNRTTYTLYNEIPRPSDNWETISQSGVPLWYRSEHGVVLPAWNHFANIVDLLSFRAERKIEDRDRHGRLPASASPLQIAGLGQVPVFNEFVSLLFACMAGMQSDQPPLQDLSNWVLPIKFVLSHDLDILLGNDKITQSIRIVKMLTGLARGRLYSLTNPWWIVYNQLFPRKFYMNNVYAMIDIERQFNFKSVLYVLNGTGGRFGFRNSYAAVQELLESVPNDWAIGLHYNYDTFLNDERFADQKKQVEETLGRPIESGRAHYLRFDPLRSFDQLAEHGIRFDESVGFPHGNGYRAGIAGVFPSMGVVAKGKPNVWELPLQFWDSHLDGRQKLEEFTKMIDHLGRIGGVTSLLFHPGSFYNLEFPSMTGVYYRVLSILKQVGAEATLPAVLVDLAENLWSQSMAMEDLPDK